MTITQQKYDKLKELNIPIRQDINARVEMIVQEIMAMEKRYEEEALALYWPEKLKERKQ